MVIASPELKCFRIQKEHDFIALASDGIFDKLSNKETVQCCWNSAKEDLQLNIHKQSSLAVEYVLKNALLRRTMDNVTVVLISFANFKRVCFS